MILMSQTKTLKKERKIIIQSIDISKYRCFQYEIIQIAYLAEPAKQLWLSLYLKISFSKKLNVLHKDS